MNLLFLKIVNMSIAASWLVLAVLVLRLILQKSPKWINVLLWGIVAVRLICPFSVESDFSLIPSAETLPEKIITGPSFDVQTGIPPVDTVVNDYLGDRYFEGVTVPANNGADMMTILAVIWAAGMVLLTSYALISYLRLYGQVRIAVRFRDNIYQSENVSSPFVLGIIRPRIYMPFDVRESDIAHVIAHEEAHISRKDHWWKPLGFLLLTLHWFNPLMWLSFALLCRDIELACDERVIKDLGSEERADYSQALVTCSINRSMISACPLAFGEVSVKDRVKSVMNYRRPKFWIVLVSVVLCIAAAACFLTDPQKTDHFYGGLNAEIIEIDQNNNILYVRDINENAEVFGERCALDCNQAITTFKLLYADYDNFGDVRDIEFTDFQVGDSVIVTLADSEFKDALNNTAVAEQVQLGTQRMNDSDVNLMK